MDFELIYSSIRSQITIVNRLNLSKSASELTVQCKWHDH